MAATTDFDQKFEKFLEEQEMPEKTRPTMRLLPISKKLQLMSLQENKRHVIHVEEKKKRDKQDITFHPGPLGMTIAGFMVTEVVEGGQADYYGPIKVGSTIEAINGEPVHDPMALSKQLEEFRKLTVGSITLTIQLPDLNPKDFTFHAGPLGMTISGFMVTEVIDGGQADYYGPIRIGSIVTAIDGKPVGNDPFALSEKLTDFSRLLSGSITLTIEPPELNQIHITFHAGPLGMMLNNFTVTRVVAGGQADYYGPIKIGSVVKAVNGNPVKDSLQLTKQLNEFSRLGEGSITMSFESPELARLRTIHYAVISYHWFQGLQMTKLVQGEKPNLFWKNQSRRCCSICVSYVMFQSNDGFKTWSVCEKRGKGAFYKIIRESNNYLPKPLRQVDAQDLYQLLSIIMLLNHEYEFNIVVEPITTPHPFFDRMVKEINKSNSRAWTKNNRNYICYFFFSFLLPFFMLDWAYMVGENLFCLFIKQKNDFQNIFGTHNICHSVFIMIIGSWIIWLPLIILLWMEPNTSPTQSFLMLASLGLLLLGFILLIILRYRSYKAFSEVVHRYTAVKKNLSCHNKVGNYIAIVSMFIVFFHMLRFAVPAAAFPPLKNSLMDFYNVVYFDFFPTISGSSAIVFCYFWIIFANFFVVMNKLEKGYDAFYISGLQQTMVILSDTLYIMITKNLFNWINCTYKDGVWILNQDENVKCWGNYHKSFVGIAMYSVIIYIMSSTILSPFIHEDMTGTTQIMFPSFYSLIQRNLNLLVILVGTFLVNKNIPIIGVTIAISFVDIGWLGILKPCSVSWVNHFMIVLRIIIIWGGICSIYASYILESNHDEHIIIFLILVGGVVIISIIGGFVCWKSKKKSFPKVRIVDHDGAMNLQIPLLKNEPEYTCPGDHGLASFRTETSKYLCNLCKRTQPLNFEMYGCQRCNWNCCKSCCNQENLLEIHRFGDLFNRYDMNVSHYDHVLKQLCYFFVAHTNSTRIAFPVRAIGDIEAEHISTALKKNTKIEILNLCFNNIGYVGTQHFSEALQFNNTVTTLILSFNPIGDVGAQSLAATLKMNTVLQKIWCENSKIGDDGVIAISESLKINSTITELFLHQNEITDMGTQNVAESLKRNSTIIRLRLNGNSISKSMKDKLFAIQKAHDSLNDLYL